ncbi:S-layer protein, partial [Candidatus Pacearchaeota archaeon]|nr:S-layer protein [Candidatus Pacearchaeota archaeon]
MLDTAKADCLAISSKRDLRIANSTQMKGGIKKMMNFRKIVSVLTSAAMLGSTVALATAASYPQPFVKNGMADAAVVYGSSAATTDVVAALDIHKQLTSQLLKEAIVTPSS